MENVLLINAAGGETRVALVENGHIAEYYLDRKRDRGIVGNIYKGKVVRVLPGMQAAFVDIGLDKAAFLYVADVFYDPDFSDQEFDLTEGEHAEHDAAPSNEQIEELEAKAQVDRAALAATEPASQAVDDTTAPKASDAALPSAPAVLALGTDPRAPEIPTPTLEGGGTSITEEDDGPSAGDDEDDEEEEDTSPGSGSAVAGDDPALSPAADLAGEPAAASESLADPSAETGAISAPRPPQSALQKEGAGRRRRRRRRGKGSAAPGAAAPASEPAPKADKRNGSSPPKEVRRSGEGRMQAQIQDLLKEGQEIIVQVVKDPIGTKGARVTSHISLPGRHLVFMPTVDHVGISRRVENERERKRLRDLVNRLRPAGTGFIVRTVADGVSEENLIADIRFLIQEWNEVGKGKDRKPAPTLLHPDLDMVLRATRDLFTHDVGKLVIDDRDEYDRVLHFVENLEGDLKSHIELYSGEEPIFDAYGVEQEIKRALDRKVWLKSGGYLIIDQAEALVAVDVNSGRYVGKKNLEETITRINVEAAKEVVYQLRLRNIGGIIIIDFIDMDKAQNREKVFKAMQEALGRDRAKTNVLKISELGLIEMTRKRVRESIGRTLNEACPYCEGEGQIKSKVTMAYEIFREIRREAQTFNEKVLLVNCHPDVAELLTNEERTELRYLMDRYNKTIQVKGQPHYHQEQYDIHGRSSGKEAKGHGPQGVQSEAAS
jgi:ribonuclease G